MHCEHLFSVFPWLALPQEAAARARGMDLDEPDPLDAFMASEVMPEVSRSQGLSTHSIGSGSCQGLALPGLHQVLDLVPNPWELSWLLSCSCRWRVGCKGLGERSSETHVCMSVSRKFGMVERRIGL